MPGSCHPPLIMGQGPPWDRGPGSTPPDPRAPGGLQPYPQSSPPREPSDPFHPSPPPTDPFTFQSPRPHELLWLIRVLPFHPPQFLGSSQTLRYLERGIATRESRKKQAFFPGPKPPCVGGGPTKTDLSRAEGYPGNPLPRVPGDQKNKGPGKIFLGYL